MMQNHLQKQTNLENEFMVMGWGEGGGSNKNLGLISTHSSI